MFRFGYRVNAKLREFVWRYCDADKVRFAIHASPFATSGYFVRVKRFPNLSTTWTAGLLSGAGMLLLYGRFLPRLNRVMFCPRGDGLKNHFLTAWHARHGQELLEFSGFNYPYGESLIFTDSHPWLAALLQRLRPIADISGYTVGLLNAGMLASVVLGAVLIAAIQEHKGWRGRWSGAWAAGLALGCSQVLLWRAGHYALSYVAAFPLAWFIVLKWKEALHWRWVAAGALVFILTFTTHVYLGVMAVGFGGLVTAGEWFRKPNAQQLVQGSALFGIPLATVWCWIRWGDSHSGRVELPFIPNHVLTWTSWLTPSHGWSCELFQLLGLRPGDSLSSWEQFGSYLGMGTMLLLVLLGWKWVLQKNKTLHGDPELLAATVLLLLAFGVPFIWGLEAWMPAPLRQFVALGRFGWVAFFVFGVRAGISWGKRMEDGNGRLAFGVALALTLAEGIGQHVALVGRIDHPNPLHGNAISEGTFEKSLLEENYQAIVPLPFYHRYTALHRLPGHPEMPEASMRLALETGVPLMSAFLSRVSEQESRTLLQLFSFPDAFAVCEQLDERPILLLTHDTIRHMPVYRNWNRCATPLASDGAWNLERLPPQFLRECSWTEVRWSDDRDGSFTLKDFEMVRPGPELVYAVEDSTFLAGSGLLRLEYFNRGYDQTFSRMWLDYKDGGGHVLQSESWDPAKTHHYRGNWALWRHTIRAPLGTSRLELWLAATEGYGSDTLRLRNVSFRSLELDVPLDH